MKLPQTPTIESIVNTCAWLPEYSRRRPINTPPSEGQLSFIQGRHGEGGGCAEGGGGEAWPPREGSTASLMLENSV